MFVFGYVDHQFNFKGTVDYNERDYALIGWMTMAQTIKPPTPLPSTFITPTVFLAGSIEMGAAENWQKTLEDALADEAIILLNPRRDEWDSSWVQDIGNPQFREQVEWELQAQEQADLIAMYFDPQTKAPITLLELGLFAHSQKLIVCCPDGYWRKGNVDIVCQRYSIRQVDTIDQLIKTILFFRQNRP